MDAERLDKIKSEIKASSVLSDQEKKEWLFLLPKMNDEQVMDLERLVLIRIKKEKPQMAAKPVIPPRPSHKASSFVKASVFDSEVTQTRGVDRSEDRSEGAASPMIPIREVRRSPEQRPEPIKRAKPVFPTPKPSLSHDSQKKSASKQDIAPLSKNSSSAVADLKKAPSVQFFLENLKKQMRVSAAKIGWSKTITNYKNSKFYRAYLMSGIALMSGQKSELTREELEGLTDFNLELKKMK